MTSAPAIGFDYAPSRWPSILLTMLGLLSLVAIALSGVATWLAVLVAMVAVAHVIVSMRRSAHNRVRQVLWRTDGGWQLDLHDDTAVEARLLQARVLAGAIFLRLRWAPRGQAALLLFPDNLDADTRRRLRMRLSAGTDND